MSGFPDLWLSPWHFCGPFPARPWFCVFFACQGPKLNTENPVLQVWPVKWLSEIMVIFSAGDALVDPVHHVNDPVGFLCHNCTLLTHMELLVHQDPQIPFHRAAPQTGPSQPVLHSCIVFCQVQDLTLVLVELPKVRCTSYQCPFISQCVFFWFSISGTLLFWIWANSEVHS